MSFMSDEALKALLTGFVRKHNLAVEELTETQLAECFRQALASGDFTRNVRAADGAQAVVYVPFSEVERLSSLYHELIFAVARKWPNEDRHETALRYIQEAEKLSQGGPAGGSELPAKAAPLVETPGGSEWNRPAGIDS